jgi:NADH dehydrogenase FAD-containing subunit
VRYYAGHPLLIIQIKCIGQYPASSILTNVLPLSITKTGYVSVRPTLQIRDDTLHHIYAIGDITDAAKQRNSISAMMQAEVATMNIINSIRGEDLIEYIPQWWEVGINLTLGLVRYDRPVNA